MEKILVHWSEGRAKGTTSLVKKSMVKGTIAVGMKVVVEWGKSKKKHNAEAIGVGGECLSPDIPEQGTNIEDETFTFEMALSAPQTSADTEDAHRCLRMTKDLCSLINKAYPTSQRN